MKTYIWNDLHWRTIAVQADSLEQAIGYVNLEIEKKKQRYAPLKVKNVTPLKKVHHQHHDFLHILEQNSPAQHNNQAFQIYALEQLVRQFLDQIHMLHEL